jgi:nitrate/nitrite-specific signal transduction histidine kinase
VVEVRTRIHNMLEVRLLYKKLEQTVEKRTAELRESEARFSAVREMADFLAQVRRHRPR